jgi:hypothetical protein
MMQIPSQPAFSFTRQCSAENDPYYIIKVIGNYPDTLHLTIKFNQAGFIAMKIFGVDDSQQTYFMSYTDLQNIDLPFNSFAWVFFGCIFDVSKS